MSKKKSDAPFSKPTGRDRNMPRKNPKPVTRKKAKPTIWTASNDKIAMSANGTPLDANDPAMVALARRVMGNIAALPFQAQENLWIMLAAEPTTFIHNHIRTLVDSRFQVTNKQEKRIAGLAHA